MSSNIPQEQALLGKPEYCLLPSRGTNDCSRHKTHSENREKFPLLPSPTLASWHWLFFFCSRGTTDTFQECREQGVKASKGKYGTRQNSPKTSPKVCAWILFKENLRNNCSLHNVSFKMFQSLFISWQHLLVIISLVKNITQNIKKVTPSTYENWT